MDAAGAGAVRLVAGVGGARRARCGVEQRDGALAGAAVRYDGERLAGGLPREGRVARHPRDRHVAALAGKGATVEELHELVAEEFAAEDEHQEVARDVQIDEETEQTAQEHERLVEFHALRFVIFQFLEDARRSGRLLCVHLQKR